MNHHLKLWKKVTEINQLKDKPLVFIIVDGLKKIIHNQEKNSILVSMDHSSHSN